jgi:hypothetical protein
MTLDAPRNVLMTKATIRTAALILLVGGQLAVLSDTTKTSEVIILALEQRFTSGLMDKNEKVFDELLAEDLIHIGFEGQIAGKIEYMSFFKTGAWRYLKYQPSNVSVKILAEAAVVTGRVDRVIKINDRETSGAFAFTHVWSRKGNTWRLRSSQVTTVPNSAAAIPKHWASNS